MAIFLLIFWMMLNGRVDADVLITGAFAALGVWLFAIFFTDWTLKREALVIKLVPWLFLYALCLFYEIVKANFGVIRVILKNNPDPHIRVIETPLQSKFARVLLANSITLTPGTVTMELDENRLTVNALTREMADGLTDFKLEKMLIKMEERIYGKGV